MLASRPGERGEPLFELFVNGSFLMSSYSGPSSTALAAIGLAAARRQTPWNILIGGLGLGFTLRRTLQDPRVGRITVAELEPCVIRWNRGALGLENSSAMRDPRVSVECGDLLTLLPDAFARYDAILLDIDNGPTWTVHEENAHLYSGSGLALVASALKPGGAVAFWASARSERFEGLLRELFGSFGFQPETDADEEGRPVEAFVYWAVKAD